MEVSGHLHTPATSYRKQPWYSLNKKLRRPHSLSGHSGGEKNLLTLLGFETQIILPIALVSIHTTPFHLLCLSLAEQNVQNVQSSYYRMFKCKPLCKVIRKIHIMHGWIGSPVLCKFNFTEIIQTMKMVYCLLSHTVNCH
jgi:hypothetical protein